jgi:hypothetical protein
MDYNITDMNQNNTQPATLVQTSNMKLTEISYVIMQKKHVGTEIWSFYYEFILCTLLRELKQQLNLGNK